MLNPKFNTIHFVFSAFAFFFFVSCRQKPTADLIIYNATIYTVDSNFSTAHSMAIKDGKVLETANENLAEKYNAKEIIDAKGKAVYPGLIDAHCHFYGYSTDLVKCDLYGTKSFAEVIEKVKTYATTNKFSWILGRGWDQNDWDIKEFPSKEIIDSLFPTAPVYLMRIDGHAILINQKAIDIAGITPQTKISGGEVEVRNGKLTGILIDNAVDSVKKFIPEFSDAYKAEALLTGQKNCFEVGLTSVGDAGLDRKEIFLIDSLQKAGSIKMRVNAMITYDDANKKYYFEKGKYKTDYLNVCSFKIYGDGALGSRGACLIHDYTDKPHHKGFLLHDYNYLKQAAAECYQYGFQMNTHCIGDSAVGTLAKIYGDVLKGKNDKRWRIEHCQVVNESDFDLFGTYSIIPSVQPTHATSDMYWAGDRVGAERIKNAYAYKKLLQQNGMVANGSDFPVEYINPLYGFYAATVRKDRSNFPDNGFQAENALTREEALKAMTIWAAYAAFEEKEKGSLEKDKFADFVILEDDIMKCAPEKIHSVKVVATYLAAKKVF
jgi:predicted amidohydrolase YtcJ